MGSATTWGEPAPKEGGREVWPQIINEMRDWEAAPQSLITDMQSRHDFGVAKYGRGLQTNNGRNAIKDSYEELLDALVYTRQALEEAREKGAAAEETYLAGQYSMILALVISIHERLAKAGEGK